MSKIYGQRGQIYRQRDKASLTVSKEGVARATEEFQGLYADVVTQAPKLNDAHPDFPGLLLHTKTMSRKNEIGICKCDYRGLDPAQDDQGQPDRLPDPVYSLTYGLTTEKLAARKDFKTRIVPAAGEGPKQAIFDEKGVFVAFGKDSNNDLAGVEQYFDVSATWSRVTVSRTQPATGGNVGKISTPPGGAPAYSNRNWLYGGMSWTKEGGIYRIDEVWLCSHDGGWNSVIYQNA